MHSTNYKSLENILIFLKNGDCLRPQIENPKEFLAFSKINKLDSFVFSAINSEQLFAEIFGNLAAKEQKENYNKVWASTLRHDTIRQHLCQILEKENYLFLDPTIQIRAKYGNRALCEDYLIKILVPNNLELFSALDSLEYQGFRKIKLNNSFQAKIVRKLESENIPIFLKRNEFTIGLSKYLPVTNGQMLTCFEKEYLTIANFKYPVLSTKQQKKYSLLDLLDSLLMDECFCLSLVYANLLSEESLDKNTDKTLLELENFAQKISHLKIGKYKIPLSPINKLLFYREHNKKLELNHLFKLFFNLRYI